MNHLYLPRPVLEAHWPSFRMTRSTHPCPPADIMPASAWLVHHLCLLPRQPWPSLTRLNPSTRSAVARRLAPPSNLRQRRPLPVSSDRPGTQQATGRRFRNWKYRRESGDALRIHCLLVCFLDDAVCRDAGADPMTSHCFRFRCRRLHLRSASDDVDQCQLPVRTRRDDHLRSRRMLHHSAK